MVYKNKPKFKPRRVNYFQQQARGVIHVGANYGQERKKYNAQNLDVLWIEPIPSIFKQLEENIAPYKNQRAINALVTDKDDETYTFYVASNHGASSSIYKLGSNFRDIHPKIKYSETLSLQSVTLPTLMNQEKVDVGKYDALVMDTQGSEFLILQGAGEVLSGFEFIKSEAANFELYKNAHLDSDISEFLRSYGFVETARRTYVHNYGEVYDILYRRK